MILLRFNDYRDLAEFVLRQRFAAVKLARAPRKASYSGLKNSAVAWVTDDGIYTKNHT